MTEYVETGETSDMYEVLLSSSHAVETGSGESCCLEKNVYNYAESSANKEKTPMCRIAELARYNKLKHEYKLLDESGPAHQKRFTVSLVLTADEIYDGSGASIKKAQQAAAANALRETRLKRPPVKVSRNHQKDPVSPTVLLTRVVQALGLQQNYRDIPVPPPMYPHISPFGIRPPGRFLPAPLLPPSALFFNYGEYPIHRDLTPYHAPRMFAVGLSFGFGMQEVIGRGSSRQKARDNAAVQALSMLGPMMASVEDERHSVINDLSAMSMEEEISMEPLNNLSIVNQHDNNNRQKSAISLVHECALQMRMVVVFEVLSEDGPAHERRYAIRCKLTSPEHTIVTEAQGSSKKAAKQNACSEMLTRLKRLESTPIYMAQSLMKTTAPIVKQKVAVSKENKRKTIVKDMKMDPCYGQQINPVSRLIQVQQMRKQPEPIFTVLGEHGHSRYKEFAIEVTCCGERCEGTGPNKKLAKRAAAEMMLARIGYVKPMPMPGKSLLKKKTFDEDPCFEETVINNAEEKPCSPEPPPDTPTEAAGSIVRRRVTFSNEVSACAPPDDLNYSAASTAPLKSDLVFVSKVKRRSRDSKKTLTGEQRTDIVNMARAFFSQSSSVESSNLVDSAPFSASPVPGLIDLSLVGTSRWSTGGSTDSNSSSVASSVAPSARDCLEKMAATDATNEQYFSLVTLGVDKPIVCHGSGNTELLAHENAAFNALVAIAGLSDDLLSPPIDAISVESPLP